MERRAGSNGWEMGLWAGGMLAAAVGLTVLAAPTEASAQYNPRARPQYGHVTLRQGFMPDPQVMAGQLGGPVSASDMLRNQRTQGTCRGFITPNPSHIVRSQTGFQNVRFVVDAQADATLIVRLPSGQFICDDDSGEAMNPLIATASRRGDIAIWVGSYSQNNIGTPYRIGITEYNHITARNLAGGGGPPPGVQIQPVNPQIQAGGINPRMAPAYGQLNLRAGFMPDPAIVSGQPGGPIRGSDVGPRCRGYYSPQPSHVINTQTGFRNIRFIVNSSVDLTLAVMLPNGQIECDDDGGDGSNPLVQTSSPPGAIRVWVGTYSQNRTAPYNMGVSELGSVGTRNIPPPGGGGVVVGPGPGPIAPPPQVQADVVQMTVGIPVTLMGPGMAGNTVAMWTPRGGSPTQVMLQGRNLVAGGVTIAPVPPAFRDPVITVQQQRNGNLVARAEQPPQGRGDNGQVMLLELRFQGGRPTIANRWTGTAVQRGPRWSR